MTQNFVDYLNYRENLRSNQQNEDIKREANRITYSLGLGNLLEVSRHNVAVETETSRHNVVTEREVKRHNLATESETYRHNVATEGISLYNAETQRGQLLETKRHNTATEAMTLQSISNDYLTKMAQVSLGYANLAETVRSHKAGEAIQYANLSELTRHNTEQENIGYGNYNVGLYKNVITQQQVEETKRHNIVQESISQQGTDNSLYGQLGSLLGGIARVILAINN